MENNQERKGFSYSYSAKERAELKRIRDKYTPSSDNEDKMERLRRLDRSVTQKAQIVALIFGILGSLLLGFGMSFAMTNLGAILGSHSNMATPIGIIIGVIGAMIACLAYPMFHYTIKREKQTIAPEIIKLTDELMK